MATIAISTTLMITARSIHRKSRLNIQSSEMRKARRLVRFLDGSQLARIANHTRLNGASRQNSAVRAARTADEPARDRRDSPSNRRARIRRLDFRLLRPGALLVPAGAGRARTPSDR